MSPGRSFGDRIGALLIRLLPVEFRGDFGAAMAADLDERRRAGEAIRWRRELPSLAAAVVREHVDVLRRDVVHTWRGMRRSPGFTALAVLMFAVGTGASAALFSVIEAVVLRSPFVEPDRIVSIRVPDPEGRPWAHVSDEQFATLRTRASGALASVALNTLGDHVMAAAGTPRRRRRTGWLPDRTRRERFRAR